jgi:hypothetical protein
MPFDKGVVARRCLRGERDRGELPSQIESNAFATLRTTDRGMNRELGVDPDAPTLPTPASEVDTLEQSLYETAPWSRASLGSVTGSRVCYRSVCTIRSTFG